MTFPTPQTSSNPDKAHSDASRVTVLTLLAENQPFQGIPQPVTLEIRYIPEREIVSGEAFATWLKEMKKNTAANAETLLHEMEEAFYNATLPYALDLKLVLHTKETRQTLHQRRLRPGHKLSAEAISVFTG